MTPSIAVAARPDMPLSVRQRHDMRDSAIDGGSGDEEHAG
jgi:hypothetical protein